MASGGRAARTGAAAGLAAAAAGLAGGGTGAVGAAAALAAAAALWAEGRFAGRAQADPQAGAAAPRPPPRDDTRCVLAALPVGVLLIESDGMVDFVNAAARETLGRVPPGRFPASLLRAPKLLEAIEAGLADAIPGEVSFTLSRGGERHVVATLRPLAAGAADTVRLLVVLEDRTRARLSEEMHRDFVANASHELKTPLSAISGLIETLQGHAREDPEATARFLALMAQQAGRMRSLVEDLISLNRIELNERIRPDEPQVLRHVLGEVIDGMQPIADAAGVALEADLPDDAVVVPGSFEELAQVFRNLIDNAVKYGADRVSLELRDSPARAGQIGVTVLDDGPGIAREHIPRLTERFYRVSVSRSRARGGTGLGLAIVKHVVSRHRGRLEIESTPGEGSRFTVWLPLSGGGPGAP